MPPIADIVMPSDPLPKRADVVIVGGGIIGVSAALFLAQQGVDVALCEKGVVAGEQSRQNWGWCKTIERPLAEVPLAMESLSLWRRANELTQSETGFRQTGVILLGLDDQTVEGWRQWLDLARGTGVDGRMVTADEVDAILPGCARKWAGGLYGPSDGVAEPEKAVPALALAARRRGAKIVVHCAVRGFEKTAGRISAVRTEKGTIQCGTAIVAAGSWSSLLCRTMGIRVPQLKILGSAMRTAPVDGGPGPAGWAPGTIAFRRRLDGGYTVSQSVAAYDIVPDSFRYFVDFMPSLKTRLRILQFRLGRSFFKEWELARRVAEVPSVFEDARTLDPHPVLASLARAQQTLVELFPAFKGVPILDRWAGLIDTTPDSLPIISWVDEQPGLFLATGFSGKGFGTGLAGGEMAVAMVMGKTPKVDARPFRLDRFSRNAKAQPSTAAA